LPLLPLSLLLPALSHRQSRLQSPLPPSTLAAKKGCRP
jgi:hypothetical protein